MISRFRYIALFATLLPSTIYACSVSRLETPEELVSGADMIVRAVAIDYQSPPANPNV
ncbi:hypothetical protein [Acidisarcina polymorpha]|uniref:hypothetical protein n=1 Tax=Acidisarcina polymorpha TaxID=2211140 RepID=UPI001374A5F8|nr:hypothetical protein [Acidisarcina polymorpha]